ncbi:subtilase family protein [Kribbella antiqua]|uniref:Subtilase family protein n=1 Tax=Kribbella antiqua TaxID=2512217 RepID=A0A4R2II83_9ACTN|nr:S8 family serine peptidase [Kribbella antiqua]TCO44553.1 subtilase family protein [Kribbella antiqua]
MPRFRPRRLIPAVAIAAVAVAAVAFPASGNQSASTASGRSAATQAPSTFTLITGDKVIARQGPGGTFSTEVRPGPGRAGMMFHKVALGKQQSVIPFDAVPLVAAGLVDPRLFDVALLADLGLDDVSSPDLPLLVEHAGRATTFKGTKIKRELPLVGAVALRQDRRTANTFWQSWKSSKKKIWLDGGIKPTLDRSVAQIGAPVAWQAGATGKGVKVAVLDSGYDATHADLEDRVVAAKSFVDDNTVDDQVGHGTHVASTVAGTGQASGGKYRGVAPEADLMIGKVCGRKGCELSDIIAGMEWAAHAGAKVVNLSLGGWASDGTDVVSQAVNELTASTGTLFVASAGNDGIESSIGSPAAADAALAVASVTKSDTLSTFSSRGPRLGDFAVKPDIAAPGDRIVAARAAGTLAPFAINPSYAELSGTSMASPHVAGAAALLAQLHPGWKAPELKAALMNSALGLPGIGVFGQGAGRVDLSRAVKQSVIATPATVDLGLQSYPHADDKPVTKTVTYRNDGGKPINLKLSLEAKPAKVFRLSRSSIVVPANGTETVDITADTSTEGPNGAYAGWLVATGNGTAIRTTVGVGKEIPSYERKIVMLDRSGKPVVNDETQFGAVFLADVEHQQGYFAVPGDTIRLPQGRYAMDALLGKSNEEGQGYAEGTYFGEPELVVGESGSLVLDGRKANKVAVQAPVAGASAATAGVGYATPLGNSTFVGGIAVINPLRPDFSPDLYVVPNATGTAKTFTGFAHVAWAKMPPDQSPEGGFYLDSPYLYHDVSTWPGRFPTKPALVSKEYAHLDASYAGEPGTRGNNYGFPSLPQKDSGGHVVGLFLFTPAIEMNLPFRRQEYYAAKGVNWAFETEVFRYLPEDGAVEYTAVVDSQHTAYPAGRTTKVRWQQGVFGPSLPDRRAGMPGREPQPFTYRDGDSLTVDVPLYADGGAGRLGDAIIDSEHTTLSHEGVELGASDALRLQTFQLPAEEAQYVLTKTATRSPDRYKLSTDIESVWTFRSQRTPDGQSTALPLMNVRYQPALDDRNRAPAGRFEVPFTIEHQYGATRRPVVSVAVEASYDGKTWHTVPVRRTTTGWTAVTDQPAGTFVSLRAHATDSAGNEVNQTIHRAFEVR